MDLQSWERLIVSHLWRSLQPHRSGPRWGRGTMKNWWEMTQTNQRKTAGQRTIPGKRQGGADPSAL